MEAATVTNGQDNIATLTAQVEQFRGESAFFQAVLENYKGTAYRLLDETNILQARLKFQNDRANQLLTGVNERDRVLGEAAAKIMELNAAQEKFTHELQAKDAELIRVNAEITRLKGVDADNVNIGIEWAKERDALQASLDSLTNERDALAQERNGLRYEVDTDKKRIEILLQEKESLSQLGQAAIEDNIKLVAEVKALTDKLAVATQPKPTPTITPKNVPITSSTVIKKVVKGSKKKGKQPKSGGPLNEFFTETAQDGGEF